MEPEDLPLVRPEQSIHATMRVIDERAKGIALVVDDAGRLLATGPRATFPQNQWQSSFWTAAAGSGDGTSRAS